MFSVSAHIKLIYSSGSNTYYDFFKYFIKSGNTFIFSYV